ncbi:hypothetical protein LOD99_4131 [Oopsacas minuta]|uniref:Uncharacterized protein n=1 Tax=Oopsacas minuta TaxID=111878 RepID=A0AAV7JWC9_9METZ|nr:hypothetical protein LOD99_4131 [Oopsacas minuta]
MDTQTPSIAGDYERMILSHEKKKYRIRLSRTRFGDLVILSFITLATLLSTVSLIAQIISFQLTRLVTNYNLTCTLFIDYNNRTLTSQSPAYCYSAISITAFVVLGLLVHALFITCKCCCNRAWKCLETMHLILGMLLLASSMSASILLTIGFQHTCNSLIIVGMACDVITGVAYKDLIRQAPTSLWLTSILLLFIEIIFITRSAVYCYRSIQTGKLRKNGKCCGDCSSACKRLKRLFSR